MVRLRSWDMHYAYEIDHKDRYRRMLACVCVCVFIIPVCQAIKRKRDEFPGLLIFGFSGRIPQLARLLWTCAVLQHPQRQQPLV